MRHKVINIANDARRHTILVLRGQGAPSETHCEMLPHADIDTHDDFEQQHLGISRDLHEQIAILDAQLQGNRRLHITDRALYGTHHRLVATLDLEKSRLTLQVRTKNDQIQQLGETIDQLRTPDTERVAQLQQRIGKLNTAKENVSVLHIQAVQDLTTSRLALEEAHARLEESTSQASTLRLERNELTRELDQ